MRNIQVLVVFWSLRSDNRPEVEEGEKLIKSNRFKEVSKIWKVSHAFDGCKEVWKGWKGWKDLKVRPVALWPRYQFSPLGEYIPGVVVY